MDMEFMDLYRRPSYNINMQSFNPQAHAQAQAHAQQPQQFPYWTPQLMAIYPNTHRQAVMMSHPNSKQTEPKPRLAKDEVEILEGEFAKNQKPNSSTKRDLAEKMGVEVPRINNWFQNRRAKEKQMRKAREFEAQQAKERAAAGGKSDSDVEDRTSTDGFDAQGPPTVSLSSAVFQHREDVDEEEEDEEEDGVSTEELPGEHLDDAADFDESQALLTSHESRSPDGSRSDTDGCVHVGLGGFAPPDQRAADSTQRSTEAFQSNQQHDEFNTTDAYPYMLSEQPQSSELSSDDFSGLPSQTDVLNDAVIFNSFGETDYFGMSHVPSFPSQMLPNNTMPSLNANTQTLQKQLSPEGSVKMEQLSPSSMSASPPAPSDLRFKPPPPPTDIAGRRNMRRPAPLGLSALRSSSAALLIKTGIEPPRRSDAASPMRRIASSTGLSGRIQKPLLSAGPRSPFTFDRNRDALLQTIHQNSRCSPVLSSLNVRSPLTPDHVNMQAMRETTVSTTASDEDQAYTYGALGPSFFKGGEHTIKTPPGTPGLSLPFQDSMYANPVEQAWNFAPQDEPLPTPSLCSHESELDFSMAPSLPGYVASQPATPSFPPNMGPTYNSFFAAHGLPATEYTFPDSYQPDASSRSSPSQPKSKTFQFAQNITPQDFSG